MASVELDPMKMFAAGRTLSGGVAPGFRLGGDTVNSGIPFNLRPDLRFRAMRIHHRANSIADQVEHELGSTLCVRAGMMIAADSADSLPSSAGWIFETGAIGQLALMIHKRFIWPDIGWKPGPGGYVTKNPLLRKILGSPSENLRVLNSPLMRGLGVVGTGLSVFGAYRDSKETDSFLRTMDAIGRGGSTLPVSPGTELVHGTAASMMMISKAVAGAAAGDTSDADAYADELARNSGTAVQAVALPMRIVGTGIADAVAGGDGVDQMMTDMSEGEYGWMVKAYAGFGNSVGGTIYDVGSGLGQGASDLKNSIGGWFN